ncbi:MAG TPA: NAD(P)-binding domain-containing protein [Candidatus Dormibacteraeota bacterium]
MERHCETVIIGGGQAGLSVGYHLARQGREFLILDANKRVGDSWRNRWDTLRVFTPAKWCGLPGMRFPGPRLSFPTKDEVGDFMADYAAKFKLQVCNGVSVEGVSRQGTRFAVTSNGGLFSADNVVVATGASHTPRIPPYATELDRGITQMHSSAYKRAGQLRDGPVLVVGLGNSGAEISYDVSRSHRVLLSGTPLAEIPVRHGSLLSLLVFMMIKFLGTHVLTMDTPIGRKVLPHVHGAPLIRLKVKDLTAAGIERVARVTGVRDGMPLLADGRTLEVANVIWCTGFRSDFGWIQLPRAFDVDGKPIQYRGAVAAEPGLYFVGLEGLYAAVSDVLPGIGRDAAYIARHIVNRRRLDRVDSEDRMVRRDPAELGVG